MVKFIDLTGSRYGRLIAVSRVKNQTKPTKWNCMCDCGSTTQVAAGKLRSGHTTSCGCRQREARIRSKTTHGMTDTGEYRSYMHMMHRCYNKETIAYANYGSRGIGVCASWQAGFAAFFADMGKKPSAAHSLDRIDNSKGYGPDNCRWANRRQQANNKRSNNVLAYGGQIDTAANWARLVGINRDCLIARLRLGWDTERALLTPVRGAARE